jgi:hypothetical protein
LPSESPEYLFKREELRLAEIDVLTLDADGTVRHFTVFIRDYPTTSTRVAYGTEVPLARHG